MEEELLFKEIKQLLEKVILKLEDSPENSKLSKETFLDLNLNLIRIKNLIRSSKFEINRRNKFETYIPNISEDRKSILEVKEFQIGTYKLNTTTRMLTRFDKGMKLTRKEMQLLAFLSTYNNVLVKRIDCLAAIWKDDSNRKARSMDVYICKIRKYLKDDASIIILNVHGSGYKMVF